MKNGGNGVSKVQSFSGEEVVSLYENLSDEEKREVSKKLLGDHTTIVFGGNNVVCSGAAIQINGTSDEIYKAIENLPPEVIGEILKAVGQYVSRKEI